MGKPNVVLIAYNGFDSAAATAILLNNHPDADLKISSAARIAGTLAKIEDKKAEIHILGVGVWCKISDLQRELKRLKKLGCKVTWYGKKDYLESARSCIASQAHLIADQDKTLPELVCDDNNIKSAHATRLIDLTHKSLDQESALKDDWVAFFNASKNRFFKYQDYEAVIKAIRKMATLSGLDSDDLADIRNFVRFGDRVISGKSKLINRLRKKIMKIAEDGKCAVLITGETGTGKDVAAQMLYECSPQKIGPLFTVNCATLDNDLTEMKLFGHEKGAFTGATERYEGVFEQASGGILFLDEIAEIPPAFQAKILRVLEDGNVRRIRGTKDISVNVRVVCATNQDIREALGKNRFRKDLYYRLNEASIHMPALRDHKEDIPIIAAEILHRFATARGRDVPQLTDGQLRQLMEHDWPGNIRELENVLGKFLIEEEESDLSQFIDSLEGEPAGASPAPAQQPAAKKEKLLALKEHENLYIKEVFEKLGKNKAKTAKTLGISPNTLNAKLKQIYVKK